MYRVVEVTPDSGQRLFIAQFSAKEDAMAEAESLARVEVRKREARFEKAGSTFKVVESRTPVLVYEVEKF